MNLEKHITELLFEHDCVIVPEFGGFVCNYSSAVISPAKHQLKPPFKKISFNRNLKNNDGLVANQIAQAEGISYKEANQAVAEYVAQINSKLHTEKRFSIQYLGLLYLGEENTLLFEQDETINYLPESFGFTSFYSPAIKRESIERKIEKKFIDKVIIPSKDAPTHSVTAAARRKRMRYVIVPTLMLLIAVLLVLPFQSSMLKKIDYSSLNPFGPKEDPLYSPAEVVLPKMDVPNESLSELIALRNDTAHYLNIVIGGQIPIVVQLKEDKTEVVSSKSQSLNSKNGYHVIGGAFAIQGNAEKLVRKLKKLGYNAQIIDKKLRLVSYGSFATREEALAAMEKIRGLQSDVWLMKM